MRVESTFELALEPVSVYGQLADFSRDDKGGLTRLGLVTGLVSLLEF